MKRSNKASSQPATKLFDHVRELRMRFVSCFIVMLVASVVVYCFYDQILTFLRLPLNAPLYYNTPAGSFSFIMKICLMGSLLITIPYIIYNLIMFVQPAFSKIITRKRIYVTTLVSSALAVSGAAFAYYMVLPGSLSFFGDFKVSELNALISADSYLNFVTNIIITFIIVFQLPLIISFIDFIKPLTPQKLFGFEKWIIIGSLVISLLAPFAFDLMTTIFVAAPIIILYNLSIVIILIQHAQTKRNNILAVIAKPEIDKQPFALDSSLSNDFIKELESLNLETPIVAVQYKPVVAEEKPIVTHRQPAQPAIPDWVIEKKQRQAALLATQMQTKVFTDFHRQAHAN